MSSALHLAFPDADIGERSGAPTDRTPIAPAAMPPRYARPGPRRAASIAAMSIFFMPIIASNARLAAARSELVAASMSTRGVICQDKPQRSLHHPHWLSAPPLLTIAFQ
jgi:hypothetical protein